MNYEYQTLKIKITIFSSKLETVRKNIAAILKKPNDELIQEFQ
jgi:hypothetical protein